MGRVAMFVGIALLVAVGGCGLVVHLLPEGYAVNAPLGQLLLGRGAQPPPPEAYGGRIRVPEGFSIGLFAEVDNARFLRPTPAGDLLVSTPRSGRVLRLEPDHSGDGRSDGLHVLLEGLNRPHGVELADGWLYVGETDAVGRVRYDPAGGVTEGPYERIVTGLPEGGNHWTRTVRMGPDGWLYVSVGSSCNVCIEDDPRRAAMLRFRPDGSEGEIYASGLRNAVGFDWQPGTGDLYATDNGRDLLGDDFPPCELNRVEEGAFYGWPFANGDRGVDPDLGAGRESEVAASISPAHGFRAHTAPLGIHFLRGDEVPEGYRGAALVALHGSWNRSEKDGYSVVSLHFGPDGQIEERDFVVGFLEDEDVIGRPVDVTEGGDGAIYVSDDYAGAIYRIGIGEGAAGVAPVSRSRGQDPLAGLTAADVAEASERGHSLYAQHACAGCHDAAEAIPGVVVRPLSGLPDRYDVDGLVALLETPTPPMPVAPLRPEERRDLAVYLLSARP